MSDKPIDDENKAQTTLTNDEIVTDPTVGRRSVLTAIGATALGAVATATAGCFATPVQQQPMTATVVQPQTGINDADPNDPAGYGRGGQQVVVVQQPGRTGITDSDPGDAGGNGRGGYRAVTGVTDGDGGYTADPGGNGRGAPTGMGTGMTDGDSGRYSDPAGGGRGPHH